MIIFHDTEYSCTPLRIPQWRMTGLVYVDMKVIYDSLSVNLFPLRFSFRSWMGKGRKYETSHLRVFCVWVHILNVHINFSPHYSAGTITIESCFCIPELAKTPFFQICIYLAELGLSCIMRDLFVVVLGLSAYSWRASSLATVHRLESVGSKLWCMGLVAPWHVGS